MRQVLVALLGLLMVGLLFSPAVAQDATPTAGDLLTQDSADQCDTIGRSLARDTTVERFDPRYAACAESGVQAGLHCWVNGDTALFETVTVECNLNFKATGTTPIEVRMADLLAVADNGRSYPAQHRGIYTQDESPLTTGESYGVRTWEFAFDIPQSTPMPFRIEFPIRTGDETLTFVVETLSVPPQ